MLTNITMVCRGETNAVVRLERVTRHGNKPLFAAVDLGIFPKITQIFDPVTGTNFNALFVDAPFVCGPIADELFASVLSLFINK